MNQALEQFRFDLQRFEDEGVQTGAQEPEVQQEPEGQVETQPEVPQEPLRKSVRDMSDDEQLAYIRDNFMNDGKPKKEEPAQAVQPQAEEPKTEPKTEPEEPTFEITVNGEKRQVKQSELIALAQKGEDYTKKTTKLAEERRAFEAQVQQWQQMHAQMMQQQQPQKQEVKPQDAIKGEYQQAVSLAERQLGIQPGEFNMFDPMHNFVLNRIMMQANIYANRQMTEREAVSREVQAFQAEIQADPMTAEIEANFDRFILQRGMATREDAIAAQQTALSLSRFQNGQATLEDCKRLKEHWAYVKGELTKAKNPQPAPQAQKPPVAPPKTEAPGVGNSPKERRGMSMAKLRELSTDPDAQLRYMKRAGIFD